MCWGRGGDAYRYTPKRVGGYTQGQAVVMQFSFMDTYTLVLYSYTRTQPGGARYARTVLSTLCEHPKGHWFSLVGSKP